MRLESDQRLRAEAPPRAIGTTVWFARSSELRAGFDLTKPTRCSPFNHLDMSPEVSHWRLTGRPTVPSPTPRAVLLEQSGPSRRSRRVSHPENMDEATHPCSEWNIVRQPQVDGLGFCS